jgi:hypothetical protein
MVSWWWIPLTAGITGFLGFFYAAWLNRALLDENVAAQAEIERLLRRIQLIGERKLDGTLEQHKRDS